LKQKKSQLFSKTVSATTAAANTTTTTTTTTTTQAAASSAAAGPVVAPQPQVMPTNVPVRTTKQAQDLIQNTVKYYKCKIELRRLSCFVFFNGEKKKKKKKRWSSVLFHLLP
jgi:hypothetical protein